MGTVNISELFSELHSLDKEDTRLNEICTYLAQATINKDVTIHNIVENLGSLLVDISPNKRENGTLILSEILKNLPNDFLTSTELHFIATFYADRLKDNHQVIPACLRGILVLIQMQNLPEGVSHKLLTALFENVPCQQQQLKDRQNIYNIFKEVLSRRTDEMKSMSLDFVLGVIQAMDGERDPRNLFLLFNWLPKLIQTINLGHLSEEMFDVISCYFPVDFRTPAQDPNNVTRDDLANALCPCLCAVPTFAEFCVPLIIDKVNSSLKIAKYDSLNLLTESCKTFDVSIYEQHSHDIWDLLQKETLNSFDKDLEEAGLNAIGALVNKLSTSENSSEFKQIVNNLYESLKGNLRPDTKLFLSSSKILLAVARASKISCTDIAPPTIDLLLNHYNLTKDTNQKEILFRTLIEFVIAYVKLFDVTNITEIKTLKEVPILCLQSVNSMEDEIRVISLESLAKISKTLPLEIREKVYEMLMVEIRTHEPENVRNSILKCFKSFANAYKNEILNLIQSPKLDLSNTDTLQLYFQALCTIVSEKTFAVIILPQILDHATNSNSNASKISIKCLKNLLEEHSDNKNIQEYLYNECNIVNKIISWFLQIVKDNNCDFEIAEDVSSITKNIVGFQPKHEQQTILNQNFDNLLKNYYNSNKVLIVLEGLLVRLHPDVEIEDKFQLIYDLLQNSSKIEFDIFLYVCMSAANMLNKSSQHEKFELFLNDLEKYIDPNIKNPDNDLHVKNMIYFIAWVIKSLSVCGSNQSELWTDKLISLLDKYEDAGKCFKLIMDDSYDCLNKKSYCTNRLLYRQKFFAYVCKKLSSNYDESKPNYFIALGYLLQLAPQQVIILYFKEILRLLVFCLELCKDPDVLCAVLNTLCTLISTKEPYLENHIDDFLPRFLNLTNLESSMRVRIAALQCIKELPGAFVVYKLLPHKQSVIHGLAPSLDDKKRLVRRQAVEARSCWFLLDAPT